MKASELKSSILEDLYEKHPEIKIHPMHSVMLDECCEQAIKEQDRLPIDIIKVLATTSFVSAAQIVKGIINGLLKHTDADTVTINYRNQSFIFDRPLGPESE